MGAFGSGTRGVPYPNGHTFIILQAVIFKLIGAPMDMKHKSSMPRKSPKAIAALAATETPLEILAVLHIRPSLPRKTFVWGRIRVFLVEKIVSHVEVVGRGEVCFLMKKT